MKFPGTVLVLAAAGALVAAAGAQAIPNLPTVSATPGALDFGSVASGATSVKSVAVSSNAYQNVVFAPPVTVASTPTITGTNASAFTLGGTCTAGASLTAGESCTAQVTFAPTAPGNYAATLTVVGDWALNVTDAASSTCQFPDVNTTCAVTIPLSGTSPAPPVVAPTVGVAITPSARIVRAGGTTTITVTTTNTGTVAAANVVTGLAVPKTFAVVRSGGGTVSAQGIQWTAASLDPSGTASYAVTLRALGRNARTSDLGATAIATDVATPATAQGKVRVVALPRKKIKKIVVTG